MYPLPDTFSAAEAAPLLCAGIIGYRALRVAQAARGDRIGLFGFGASAHLVLHKNLAAKTQIRAIKLLQFLLLLSGDR